MPKKARPKAIPEHEPAEEQLPVLSEPAPHYSRFSDFDISLFKCGKHFRLYDKLGAHLTSHNGEPGIYFAVWAPNAVGVSVIGQFNNWNREAHPMVARPDYSGIWETFIPIIGLGEAYKFFIRSANGYSVEKGDPYAHHWETPPLTASVTWSLDYTWNDTDWMETRAQSAPLAAPLSIYEVHLGSWRRGENNLLLTYLELAEELPKYCIAMGFTHVELLPVMEHPFYGSWGYQITGYFAPSSRYGTPQDFMALVDALHRAGIGVILDWVPSHFPTDEHGLSYFDGTHLYEYGNPQKGYHPDWNSLIPDYSRYEVRAFLISNALFWLDKYHIDGLRVDAVASMLHLDYSREHGQWSPNELGGRENLEAISFIKELNEAVHTHHPDTFTVAEESTSFPAVTAPVSSGGLGFDLKWMMGWMHDTLNYFKNAPIYRSYHHSGLAFSIYYAWSEKFVLPLSHDEVVHGKYSMLYKMPGDEWQRFANLRLLYAYMWGHPGAKMLFMGDEFGQAHEWRHDYSLDWHEAERPYQRGLQTLLRDLNALYKSEPAMYVHNYSYHGFEWIDYEDTQHSVLSWIRKCEDGQLIFVANYTPVVRSNFRIGVPARGQYAEVLNSDNERYGGSGVRNVSAVEAVPLGRHGKPFSLSLTLPPLGLIVLKITGAVDSFFS